MDTGSAVRGETGSITGVEVLSLATMVVILIAIAIPSYLAVQDRSSDRKARADVQRAAAAAEEYRAAQGSTRGLSAVALGRYDPALDPSSYGLEVTGLQAYCVEASSGGREWHLAGPAGSVARGGCP